MKKSIPITVLGFLFIISNIVFGGEVTIPNTFSANTTAVASDVNENFSAVKIEVDDNSFNISTNANNIAINSSNIDAKQSRVTGTCQPGEAVRVINNDGTVLCEPISQAVATSPVAYGVIDSDGTVISATTNISSSYNAASTRYEITISDHSYLLWDYSTVITVLGSVPLIATENSVGGDLLVELFDMSGNSTTGRFNFIIYKP